MIELLDQIFEYAENQYPKECCGIIAEIAGNPVWVPSDNHAENPEEEFVLDSVLYIKTCMKAEKILAIVHSHPDGEAKPSDHDIKACNFLMIPYLIVNWPEKDFSLTNPGDLHA